MKNISIDLKNENKFSFKKLNDENEMLKILKFFLVIITLQIAFNCQQNRKKMSDSKLFSDGFSANSGLQLFTLLDPYPSLKQPFKSMKVDDFNIRLDNSLKLSAREDILGVLRMIQRIFLNARPQLQNLLDQVSKIVGRIQRNNPTTYNNILPLLERIRNYPKPVIRNLIPITTTYLLGEYNSKTSRTIGNQILDFGNVLGNQNSKDLLEKYQDLAVKAIRTNTNFRAGIEEVLNNFLDPVLTGDKKLIDRFTGLAYIVGEVFFKRGGALNDTSSETVIKTLMVNLEKFYTIGGSQYSSIYSYSNATPPIINPAELNSISIDLYILLRQFVVPATVPITKNPTTILADSLAQNLALLPFTSTVTNAESSLLDLINIDSKGLDRRTVTTSNPISALESLFLTLSIVDIFGYNWNVVQTDRTWITSSTGGQINVGDTLWSLQSIMQSPPPPPFPLPVPIPLNFNAILTNSKNIGKVFKTNSANNLVTLTGTNGIDFNTPVLSLLERESIGSTLPIEAAGTDSVYRNTVPWVLNWIKRVTYSGYGPYYNKNKTDSNGNFLSPDGSIARFKNNSENNFKPTWQTAKYKICIRNNTTGANCKDIGLGGNEYAGQSASGNPANLGTGYTIYEINKTDDERAVDSDEEAFYKNFQWLLYEKRFVVIIPALAKLDASLAFEESLFIVAIGNGLKGMMSIKPYCPSGAASSCGGTNNGTWLKNTSTSLRNSTPSYQDLVPANFSSQPGDSALYVQGWGYGAAGNLLFQDAFVLATNAVWPLLIPNPSLVYGLIPPVISFNFPVLERLGFTNSATVLPSTTSANWEKRNRLLPLVVALAKTLDDEVDVATNKNPHKLLTDLSKLLSRPYLFKELDNVEIPAPAQSSAPTILSFRLTDDEPFRNAKAGELSYLPPDSIYLSPPIDLTIPLKSPISLLIENERRFQNGLLNLVAKTDTINYLIQMLSVLGEPSRTIPRNKVWTALQKLSKEIKINIDGATASNQFNFQGWINEQVAQLAVYPDTRSTDVRNSSWAGVDDSIAFTRDYFSKTSGYSLTKSLDFSLGLIVDVKPTALEIKSILDLVDSLLSKEANGRYNLTNILTDYVPPILTQMAPNGRNFFGVFYSLASPNGFVNFMETNMSFSPFTIANLISDLENLMNSNMIKSSENNANSLLFSSGTLISLFADIYEFGKKMDSKGFPFADGLNTNENNSVFQRLNIIMSTK